MNWEDGLSGRESNMGGMPITNTGASNGLNEYRRGFSGHF